MPRNISGVYTLPAGNPVAPDTVIESVWANTTLTDLAQAMTDSLDRFGRGVMLAPLKISDGSQAAPGLSFASEAGTGIFRPGAGTWGLSVLGTLAVNTTDAATTLRLPTTVMGHTGNRARFAVGSTAFAYGAVVGRGSVEANGDTDSLLGLSIGGVAKAYFRATAAVVGLYSTNAIAVEIGTSSIARMVVASDRVDFSVQPRWGTLPVLANDLANKAYVDAAVSGSGAFLPITGGNLLPPGNLGVTNLTVAGTLGVNGLATFGAITANGVATFNAQLNAGNVGVAGTLTVTGAATLNGSLTVGGVPVVPGNYVLRAGDTMTGPLGIGIAPTRKLTIGGAGAFGAVLGAALRLDNTTSGRAAVIDNDDSEFMNLWASDTGAGGIRFFTGAGSGTERARLSGAGNFGIGIGNANPLGRLHVGNGFMVNDGGSSFATTKTNSFGVLWSAAAGVPSLVLNGQATERPEISFYRGSNAFPEFTLREHASANVGGQILAGTGTVAPAVVAEFSGVATQFFTRIASLTTSALTAPLTDLATPGLVSGALLQNSSPTLGSYTALSLSAANSGTTQVFSLVAQSIAAGFSPDLSFVAKTSAGGGAERMRVAADGRVSIGGVAPLNRLHVHGADGTGTDSPILRMSNVSGTLALMGIGNALIGTAPAQSFALRAEGALLFASGGGLERAQISAAGVFTYSSSEVGWRDVPAGSVDAPVTAADRGKMIYRNGSVPGALVVPTLPAGAIVSMLNTGVASATLNADVGITLKLAGTALTGSRTLAPEGIATLYWRTATTVYVSGPGVS